MPQTSREARARPRSRGAVSCRPPQAASERAARPERLGSALGASQQATRKARDACEAWKTTNESSNLQVFFKVLAFN